MRRSAERSGICAARPIAIQIIGGCASRAGRCRTAQSRILSPGGGCANVNCDRIARAYRWFEYAAFGRELERRRFRYLSEVASAKRALILGDGDGRFLARFSRISEASVEYVDSSKRMLQLAGARAGCGRTAYRHGDARALEFESHGFDLIVTHFFLDCFDSPDLERLIARLQEVACPGALWLVSEFREPVWAAPLIRALYLFFRL